MSRQSVTKTQATENLASFRSSNKSRRKSTGQRSLSTSGLDRRSHQEQQTDMSSYRLAKSSSRQHSFSQIPAFPNTRLPIQAKLKIGQPNDKYEQEADRVADQVMRMPDPRPTKMDSSPLGNRTIHQNGTIQRTCSTCAREYKTAEEDNHPVQSTSLCPKCRTQRQGLIQTMPITPLVQTKPTADLTPEVTPTINAGIQSLQGGGQPLSQSERSFFEPRFGANFSGVRVHNDARAASVAQSINARAFTHGSDVVFGAGEYSSGSDSGKRLLAHELTHVVQQSSNKIEFRESDNFDYIDAMYAQELIHMDQQSYKLPQVQKQAPEEQVTGSLDSLLPGYSQERDTCGAASLVTALVIWDRAESSGTYELIFDMLNIIQTWMIHNRSRTIDGWNDRGFDGEGIYEDATDTLDAIRAHLILPDARLSESEYQAIGVILYALYIDRSAGLSASEIWNLQARLGLETNQQSILLNYSNLFSNPILVGLNAGQIAQVGWVVRTGEPTDEGRVPIAHHAFLIGRFQSGEWFLSDQGTQPAAEFTAQTIGMLEVQVTAAARSGSYWIYTGSVDGIMGWTGVRLLAGPDSVHEEAQSIIPSGTILAEIDAGFFTSGDTVTSGDFVETAYNIGDANLAAGSVGSDHGAVIIEIPQGVFHVYETSLIREENMHVSGIDTSAGGLLTRRIYYSARLITCDGNMCNLIEVY